MIKTLMMLILSLFLVQKAFSQASSAPTESIADPLVRVLIAKGILTEVEGRSIGTSGNPVEQRDRLATLLRDKGLLTGAEYEAIRTVVPAEALAKVASPANESPRAEDLSKSQTPAPAPTVIAAVAPVRLLGALIRLNEKDSFRTLNSAQERV